MMIDLRSSNLPISLALREHIERRLDFAIRRFASRISRVVVRLVDVNGPRGGPDKRCRIIAHLSPTGNVMVEATDADVYAAASQAAIRLDERVARALQRRRPRPLSARHGGARLRRSSLSTAAVEKELP
jgi:ribosomal subunit interface protein